MLIKPVEKDQEPKSTRWKALKGSSAFSLAMKQQSVAVGCFVIYFLSQTKENLAGFILSRKQIKSSVIRNKIKRTVHETIRLINAKNKHWIVVRARSSIDSAKFDNDRQKLINTLIKVIK
jgi:ribonuclease P protein component